MDIASGAQINLQENTGVSPLYIACQNGHIDVVKELVASGAQIDLHENTGAFSLVH